MNNMINAEDRDRLIKLLDELINDVKQMIQEDEEIDDFGMTREY